jgi:diguanylate cyclase
MTESGMSARKRSHPTLGETLPRAPIDYAPALVVLSVVLAIQGAFVALVLATRMRATVGRARLALLAASAVTLGVAIWAMHFVGMLALSMPAPAHYLAGPTLLSFVVAIVAVGGAIALVASRPLSGASFLLGALLMGAGIVGMHFIGMSALSAGFLLTYDPVYVIASTIIGISASGLGLHLAFRTGEPRRPPVLAAILIGLAISGMHYTAMEGTTILCAPAAPPVAGLSPRLFAALVSAVAFGISLGFLLILNPARVVEEAAEAFPWARPPPGAVAEPETAEETPPEMPPASPRLARALPAERQGRRIYVAVERLRAVHANGHYTTLADEEGEALCLLSIGTVETKLDPQRFLRVHRSHLVALDAVTAIERTGDGGLAWLAGAAAPVPVSRSRLAALRAGLAARAEGQPG